MSAFLRKASRWVSRTPLHPQWLMGRRRVPGGLDKVSGRVLDIGSADSWIRTHVANSAEYIALDYPITGMNMYGARPAIFGDGARLPLKDGCIDAVLCLEVLEHVKDPSAVFREISRVLVPGGRAWISMPFLYPVHDAPHDFQRYTRYALMRDAEISGLETVALIKRGHCMESAGLLASLAVTGPILGRSGLIPWVMAPIAALFVVVANLTFKGLSWILPDWDGMCIGHELELAKPISDFAKGNAADG